MPLDDETIKKIKARDVPKVADNRRAMDSDGVFAAQDPIRISKEFHSQASIGQKAGLPSLATMNPWGMAAPMLGCVSSRKEWLDGGEIRTAELVEPKVRAQICIVTKAELKGPGCDVGVVLAAIECALPAVEIIDASERDRKSDSTSLRVNNVPVSRFVVGRCALKPDAVDMHSLGVVIEKNGQVVAMTVGAAVVCRPAAAVATLANQLAARGHSIPAGTFIMTGGVVEAIAVAAGDSVVVRFQDLGQVLMRFV